MARLAGVLALIGTFMQHPPPSGIAGGLAQELGNRTVPIDEADSCLGQNSNVPNVYYIKIKEKEK